MPPTYPGASQSEAALQLAAVRALNILDTPRDPSFDRLVFTAAQLFRVPTAALSVMDEERVWYKARVGLTQQSIDRAVAFCNLAIRQPAPLVVEDATMDPRFHDNPLLGGAGIRFYAGAPVLAPERLCARLGAAGPVPVGVLCVMDRRRRVVTTGQVAHLVQLAREAQALLAALDASASTDRDYWPS